MLLGLCWRSSGEDSMLLLPSSKGLVPGWGADIPYVCVHAQSCPTLCDLMDCSSSVHGDSPGKNTGVGCHFFLQGIFPIQGLSPRLPHCRWVLSSLNPARIRRPPVLGTVSAQVLGWFDCKVLAWFPWVIIFTPLISSWKTGVPSICCCCFLLNCRIRYSI